MSYLTYNLKMLALIKLGNLLNHPQSEDEDKVKYIGQFEKHQQKRLLLSGSMLYRQNSLERENVTHRRGGGEQGLWRHK